MALRDIPQLKHFDKTAKDRESKLQGLEQQAEAYQAQVEHYQNVEQHLVELQRQQATLYGERDVLRGEYADATFENDFDRIQRVHEQREEIDNRLGEVFQQIQDTEDWLQEHPLPVTEIAAVLATSRMLTVPSVTDLVAKIQDTRNTQSSELRERQNKLQRQLGEHVTSGDIHDARIELDSDFAEATLLKERLSIARKEYEEELDLYEQKYGLKRGAPKKPILNGFQHIANSVKADGGDRDLVAEGVVS